MTARSGPLPPAGRTHVRKGWGSEEWVWNSELYCGKFLRMAAGRRSSWHYHVMKDEVLYLLEGRVLFRYSGRSFPVPCTPQDRDRDYGAAQTLVLGPGDAFHVAPYTRHQAEALEGSVLVEFSTHHDDADSYRVLPGD